MGLKISWSEECLSTYDTKCRSTEKNIGQFDLEKNLPGKNIMNKVKKANDKVEISATHIID